jgi:TonB family protein
VALSRTRVALFALALALALATASHADRAAKAWHPLEGKLGDGADTTIVGFGVDALGDEPEPAMLVCRCRAGELELFVIADTGVVGSGASRSVSVFVDERPATFESWLASKDGSALFAREPRTLVRQLARARALELGIRVAGGRTETLRFDVRGFASPLHSLEVACPQAPSLSAPPPSDGLPAFGEYVYVEELPEVITRVPPGYPDEARGSRIEGTVVMQVLVGVDGRVKDVRHVNALPILDQAAEACVRQWTFKPALANGRPVAIWVAVPIKFSLH